MAGWRNLYTRKISASGTVDADGNTVSDYGRIHRIDVTTATEIVVRDGPEATDPVLHRVYVPLSGLVPGCDAAWRLPRKVHYYEVAGNTWITFI